jgi:O-antigen ligase
MVFPAMSSQTVTEAATVVDKASVLQIPAQVRTAVAAMAALLLLTNLSPSWGAEGGSNLFRQIAFTLLFLVAAAATLPLRNLARLFVVPASLVVALGWCWLSTTWAVDPGTTLRRIILTTMIIWSVFLMVELAGSLRTIATMRACSVAALVVNYLMVLAAPSIGVHGYEVMDPSLVGDWRGFTPSKNFAGAVCALTVIMFMLGAPLRSQGGRAGVVLAALVFLYKSDSATSQGMLLLAVGAGWVFRRYNPDYRAFFIPAVMIAGVVVVLGLLMSRSYFEALSSSRTAFTGRIQIWNALIRYSEDNLWFGSGYGSFWNIGGESPIFRYARGWVAETITSGHNGYLDLLAQVGIPGLALVLFAALVLPLVKLLSSRTLPRGDGSLIMAIVLFVAGHNLTESSLFERDVVTQVYLIFAIALLAQHTGRLASSAPATTS